MVAAFKRAGLTVERTEGDHVVMNKAGMARPVIVPLYDDLPDFIISKNIRTAGLNRKQYIELLTGRPRGRKKRGSRSS